MKENKQVTKTNDAAIALLKDAEFTGFENVNPSKHLQRPLLKIAQSLTAQVKKSRAEYIKDLEIGMFFNSATRKIYGNELKIVPLYWFPNCVIYGPNGLGDFKGTITEDDYSLLMKSGAIYKNESENVVNKEGDIYILTYNFIAFLPDYPEDGIVLYPMSGAGLTPNRKWLSLIKSCSNNMYDNVWKIKTENYSKDSYDWYNIGYRSALNVERVGPINEKIVSDLKDAMSIVKDYINNRDNINYSEAIDNNNNERSVTSNNIDSADM